MNKNNNDKALFHRVGAFFKPRFRGASPNSLPSTPTTGSSAKCSVRLDMEARLERANRPLPTEDQWKMILSDADTTRVVAGAGSGKSTTLVLRIIAMCVYRNVPFSRLRVVTFTRNSRADFIDKLRSTAAIWDIDLSMSEASAIVRTFHSLVFAQAKAAGMNVKTLDQLDSMGESSGSAAPFPALSVDPDSELAAFLNESAAALIRANPSFAQVITALYDHSFLTAGGMPLDDSKAGRISAVQKHDYERTAFLNTFWKERVAPDLMNSSLIDFTVQAFQIGPLYVNGREVQANGPWWANAFIPKMNAWLMLGGAERFLRGKKMPDGFAMAPALGAKKSCVNVLTSNENVIWVNSPDDLAALHMRLQWGGQSDCSFPKFGVRLTGEVVSTPLLVAFWQQAQFIQSLGLDVASAASEAAKCTKGVDMLFAKALALFWPFFMEQLEKKGYTLSNHIFMELANPALLRHLPDSAVLGVQHLLIDEFQDISGIIVNWLKAVRGEIQRRGHQTSLMVVGDDWQSIYGWRGASPHYFTNFFNWFGATSGKQQTVYLSENFRSSQAIVDAASVALQHVTEKIDKACVAKGRYASLNHPVSLVRGVGDIDPDSELVRDYLDNESTFIIARTRSALAQFQDETGVRLTIHGSKGLEADYVLLVDDFAPPSTHPLRCCWYAKAGLGDYDAAQSDETMRLAYVAITRAKKGCRWLVRNEVPNGVFLRFADTQSAAINVIEAEHV